MLGGWMAVPGLLVYEYQKGEDMEDKIDALYRLLNTFAEDEKDKILEILQLALEIIHPATSE